MKTYQTKNLKYNSAAQERYSTTFAYAYDRSTSTQRYCFYSRRLAGLSTDIGLTVDASRVSKKQVLLGFTTTPSNLASWLPPQVSGAPLRTNLQKSTEW